MNTIIKSLSSRLSLGLLLSASTLVLPNQAYAEPCDAAETADAIGELLSDETSAYKLTCSVTLNSSYTIRRKIVLEGNAASNVVLDCGNAKLDYRGTVHEHGDGIEIKSRLSGGTWQRPQNVTVRNCKMYGAMRIWGYGKNGEAERVRASSRQDSGHVGRLRSGAPSNILLDNLYIHANGRRTPLYISPGVSYVTLQNSEITGQSHSVGIYLDTESYRNTIRNNYLHVTSRKEYVGGIYTRKREEIAIDNSSFNKIYNNRLSSLEGGGIYLYRNCGEGGTVRHGRPEHNQIINNVFYYNRYNGDNPSVHIGSRGNNIRSGQFYCGDDDGFPWGSSASNRNHARNNIVMQNQIYKLSVSKMIRESDSTSRNNEIDHNETVTSAISRRAGCYVPGRFYKNFIEHGEVMDVYLDNRNEPQCTTYARRCNDGVLERTTTSCRLQTRSFSCTRRNSNDLCTARSYCPSGTDVVTAKAACNLEYGDVSWESLSAVAQGTIDVQRESDNTGDGYCSIKGLQSSRTTLARREFTNYPILDIAGDRGIQHSCKEKDKNGGECQIRGHIICR